MSKAGKFFLWIAIPVAVLAILVGAALWQASFSYPGKGIAGVPSFGMMGRVATQANADYSVPGRSAGLAPKEEAGFAENSITAPVSNTANDEVGNSTERLIVKTGSLSMVVSDVRSAIAAVSKYAIEKKGFVVSSNVAKEDLALTGEIVIRIPSAQFDAGVAQVKTFGQVESESVTGQDVTSEYVDLGSQLKNLNATESQLLSIMQRAVKIEDVLAVQEQLTQVRGQIESIQGRMKYLKESAQLSSLTVYLSTDPSTLPVKDEQNAWKPWAVVKDSVRGLLAVGQALVNVLIWLVIYIPLWVLIGLVVWGVVRLVKRVKNKS